MKQLKTNDKSRNDYLAMNLHDRDIRWIALAEGKQIGLQEGAEQKAIETAKKMLQEGLTVEQIARCTDLPLEKVQELANITQN